MELSIDTSTDWASLALSWEGEVAFELSWRCDQGHLSELFPNLRHLMAMAGLQPQELRALIVARGPGSFNGLRVGVSAAKGLALALGIPAVGVDTLEAEAFSYASFGLPICPLQEAGRGEVAAALFQGGEVGWRRLWEDRLLRPQELAILVKRRTLFCGSVAPETESIILSSLGKKAVIARGHPHRAGPLARLGWEQHCRGLGEDAASLQPLYLRRPAITQRQRP